MAPRGPPLSEIESLAALPPDGCVEALLADYLAGVAAALGAAAGRPVPVAPWVEATLANLPAYLPPRGRVLLARGAGGAAQGQVLLRRVRPDAAEMKRLYVAPAARGTGLGRRLAEAAVAEARAMGAATLLLDTGRWMGAAQALYRAMGFAAIPRYPESENDPALADHFVYMARDLTAG